MAYVSRESLELSQTYAPSSREPKCFKSVSYVTSEGADWSSPATLLNMLCPPETATLPLPLSRNPGAPFVFRLMLLAKKEPFLASDSQRIPAVVSSEMIVELMTSIAPPPLTVPPAPLLPTAFEQKVELLTQIVPDESCRPEPQSLFTLLS